MPKPRKIFTVDHVRALRREAGASGKTVVHCHGCFDIVHPGHIQHLEFAKSLGDYLIVSVSADTHVNKGVDRPLIPDNLRAASLAALECVDWVCLNPDPTAENLLEAIRPDVYVKGREYETNQDPRFVAERETVVRHGGRVVFSSGEIVYSSTALIGQLEQADQFHDEKVQRFRDRYDLSSAALHNLVMRFRNLRVVVVGDYILDRYHFCDASGVASEGPMMTLRSLQQKDFDGGAGVIALHLAGMGANPTLITTLADDELSHQTDLRLRSAGVDVDALPNRRQVVTKHRYLVDAQKIFKVDDGPAAPLDSKDEESLAADILEAADGAAAVVFADFGYGTITAGLLDRVMEPLRRRTPIITADVSGRQGNLLRFKSVDLLCPTEREARETLHDFSSGLSAVVWNLMHATSAKQTIITLGKQGLVTFDHPGKTKEAMQARLRSEYVPAFATRAVDPLGCGDAMLSAASLTLAAGGSLQAAAFIGSIAAAFESQQLGNEPITADALLARIHHSEHGVSAKRLAS